MDEAERTADGRHIVGGGRKWRATDPGVPDRLRSELVAELMSARRAVGSAKRSRDEDRERAARRRVSDAKHALGERGRRWWDPPDDDADAERSASSIRALLRHRAPESSICPSEVARIVGSERWRNVLATVRRSAIGLVDGRVVKITRGENTVDSFDGGPVRIRRGADFPDPPAA